MSFVLYTPTRNASVQSGQAAIDSNAFCRLCPADLAAVGINGKAAVVMVDTATQRIALKAPATSDDGFTEPTIYINRGKSGGKATVGLSGPLRALGLPNKGRNRSMHEVMIKDNLLIILVGTDLSPAKRRHSAKK